MSTVKVTGLHRTMPRIKCRHTGRQLPPAAAAGVAERRTVLNPALLDLYSSTPFLQSPDGSMKNSCENDEVEDERMIRERVGALVEAGDAAGLLAFHCSSGGAWSDLEHSDSKSIIANDGSVETQQGWRWSPLAQAAGKKQLDVMRVLLDLGARVGDTREYHTAPAIEAALGGFAEGLKLLDENGCPIARSLAHLEWAALSPERLRAILLHVVESRH